MVRRVDVARLAGVTPAVVSYVTNDSHPVSPETRRRVIAAIEELGYRPNAVARALATARTQTVGLIVPNVVNPFFAELSFALEASAFRAGYTVLVGNAWEEDRHALDYVRVFADRQVDGLVIAPITGNPREILETAERHRIPIVFTDRVTDAEGTAVLTDNVAGARRAARHLVEHGRRLHACITGPRSAGPAVDRARGWSEELAASGVACDSELIEFRPFSPEGGYDATRRLVAMRPGIDAILVGSDIQAAGVLRALRDLGRTPGTDVAVIAYDGTKGAEYTYPRLTTISQPIDLMAATIIELLVGLIESREEGAAKGTVRMLPTELTIRESCGCPPQVHPRPGTPSDGASSIPQEGVR